MISIIGAGWLGGGRYGTLKGRVAGGYRDVPGLYSLLRRQKPVFRYPVKDWGRFDETSRTTCLACGLAIWDAGLVCSREKKQELGIVGTNTNASLQSNVRYFKDYLENGRTLARGNLFIYTIPSSPLAETAIHFGLTGPLFFISSARNSFTGLLDCAAHLITGKAADVVLAVRAEEAAGIAFTLATGEQSAAGEAYGLDRVKKLMQGAPGLEKAILALNTINQQKMPNEDTADLS